MKEKTVAVCLPVSLGVKACGPYKAGEIYQVSSKEADRLINVKRFERVNESPESEQE